MVKGLISKLMDMVEIFTIIQFKWGEVVYFIVEEFII